VVEAQLAQPEPRLSEAGDARDECLVPRLGPVRVAQLGGVPGSEQLALRVRQPVGEARRAPARLPGARVVAHEVAHVREPEVGESEGAVARRCLGERIGRLGVGVRAVGRLAGQPGPDRGHRRPRHDRGAAHPVARERVALDEERPRGVVDEGEELLRVAGLDHLGDGGVPLGTVVERGDHLDLCARAHHVPHHVEPRAHPARRHLRLVHRDAATAHIAHGLAHSGRGYGTPPVGVVQCASEQVGERLAQACVGRPVVANRERHHGHEVGGRERLGEQLALVVVEQGRREEQAEHAECEQAERERQTAQAPQRGERRGHPARGAARGGEDRRGRRHRWRRQGRSTPGRRHRDGGGRGAGAARCAGSPTSSGFSPAAASAAVRGSSGEASETAEGDCEIDSCRAGTGSTDGAGGAARSEGAATGTTAGAPVTGVTGKLVAMACASAASDAAIIADRTSRAAAATSGSGAASSSARTRRSWASHCSRAAAPSSAACRARRSPALARALSGSSATRWRHHAALVA
jgi:hypothetical protein